METAGGEKAEERKKEEERRGQTHTFLSPSSQPNLSLCFPVQFSVDLLEIRYAVIFAWFCPCVLGWFYQLFIFSARHQLDTWTLAPQKTRGMT